MQRDCYQVYARFVRVSLSSRRESQSSQCINYVTGQNSADACVRARARARTRESECATRLRLSSGVVGYTCVLVRARARSCAPDTYLFQVCNAAGVWHLSRFTTLLLQRHLVARAFVTRHHCFRSDKSAVDTTRLAHVCPIIVASFYYGEMQLIVPKYLSSR